MMNRDGGFLPETHIDMDIGNEERKKILPKPLHKKEKNGRKKMKLDLKKTSTLLSKKKMATNNNEEQPMEPPEEHPLVKEEAPPPKFFGVRNYLHNFYDTVSIRNPQLYEDIPADEPGSPQGQLKDNNYLRLCARVWMGIALTLVFVGLVLMLVGFITPLHSTVAAKNAEFLIIDRTATQFNEHMRICRWVGIYIFLTGFFIFMLDIMASIGFSIFALKNDDDEESISGDNFCLTLEAEDGTYQQVSSGVPLKMELAAVQPKRGKEDVVVARGELVAPQPVQVLKIKTEK